MQHLRFVVKYFWKIHLDPLQRCRHVHAIWPLVETDGEVDDHIAAVLKLIRNGLVEEIRARNLGPGVLVAEFNGVGNPFAALACQSPREWIAKECVEPFGFHARDRLRPSALFRRYFESGVPSGSCLTHINGKRVKRLRDSAVGSKQRKEHCARAISTS